MLPKPAAARKRVAIPLFQRPAKKRPPIGPAKKKIGPAS